MTTYEPGTEIARYRIEFLIGRGDMGTVYRAEDMRLGRKVALKLLSPELAVSERFRRRFLMESELAATLDHPNIIPIYDAGKIDGQLFIAMRYVLGDDLKGLLTKDGPLAAGRTLRLFGQIGDALGSAHRAGLVHRDVKPANILVAAGLPRPASGDHVYVTDFGLRGDPSEETDELTGTGRPLGTVEYVSPEQIQGRPVGPAADIYALGSMLYECLTGQPPFRRDDVAALLWAHLVEAPPPVTELRPDIPKAVDAVIARAMAKDPADRYESCQEFLRALEVALDEAAPVSSPGEYDDDRDRGGFAATCAAPPEPPEPPEPRRPARPATPAADRARAVPAAGATRAGSAQSPRRTRIVGAATTSHISRSNARRHSALGGMDDEIRRIISPGRIVFDAPDNMRQGRVERVKVGIARTREFDDELRAALSGKGNDRFEDIDTSPLMGVELRGTSFEITSLSTPDGEQLLSPIAHWEFDVLPRRSGMQKLQLVAWMGILLPGRPQGRRSVPVLEWEVQVRVDPVYGMRQFVTSNWQWLGGTVIATGGGLTAWIKLVG
jgi:serine/threonine protein kinase